MFRLNSVLALAVVFCLLLVGRVPAHADAFFSAHTDTGDLTDTGCLVKLVGGGSTSPIGADTSCGDSFSVASGQASANFGSVGAAGSSAVFITTSLTAGSNSRGFFQDFVTFHSNDPKATSVVTDLLLNFTGSLASTPGALAQVTFVTALYDVASSFSAELDGGSLLFCDNQLGNSPACADTYNGALMVSRLVEVPLDQPVFFSLDIRTQAGSSGDSSASAKFADTLSLNTNGPVFDLPDGFTANAGDYIVDNRFVPVGQVPEPGSLALFGSGLVGVLGIVRRRLLA